jgi:hypothetical protein
MDLQKRKQVSIVDTRKTHELQLVGFSIPFM